MGRRLVLLLSPVLHSLHHQNLFRRHRDFLLLVALRYRPAQKCHFVQCHCSFARSRLHPCAWLWLRLAANHIATVTTFFAFFLHMRNPFTTFALGIEIVRSRRGRKGRGIIHQPVGTISSFFLFIHRLKRQRATPVSFLLKVIDSATPRCVSLRPRPCGCGRTRQSPQHCHAMHASHAKLIFFITSYCIFSILAYLCNRKFLVA